MIRLEQWPYSNFGIECFVKKHAFKQMLESYTFQMKKLVNTMGVLAYNIVEDFPEKYYL